MAYESYIEGYKKRLAEMRRANEELREQLIGKLRGLESYFEDLPGLRRVYLFGSAANRGAFNPGSDADLAFEGLPPERFCSALSELVDLLDRNVDAVRIEDASELLKEQILKGLVVYERRPGKDP